MLVHSIDVLPRLVLATACLMLCINFCEACSSGYSRCCNSDKCIRTTWIQDGDNDCRDGSDETYPPFQCDPAQFIEVRVYHRDACSGQSAINGVYELQGTTANNWPYYQNEDEGAYLYQDPNCNGRTRDWRWIFDDSKPSLTRTYDLDADLDCTYNGYQSSRAYEPPKGRTNWRLKCSDVWEDVTLLVSNIDVDDVCVADETCSPAACRNWTIDDDANLIRPGQSWIAADFNACKAKCSDTSACMALSYKPGGGGYVT